MVLARRHARADGRARRRRLRQGLRHHLPRDPALADAAAARTRRPCPCARAWWCSRSPARRWPRRLPVVAPPARWPRGARSASPPAAAAVRLRALAPDARRVRPHVADAGRRWAARRPGSSWLAVRRPRVAPAAALGRHVGLRARGADAAHGVHRDRVRRAAAPHLRRALPADRGRHDRPPSGVALLRAVHRLPQPASCRGSSAISTSRCSRGCGAGPGARALQSGSVHAYLAYLVVALVLLLALLVRAGAAMTRLRARARAGGSAWRWRRGSSG